MRHGFTDASQPMKPFDNSTQGSSQSGGSIPRFCACRSQPVDLRVPSACLCPVRGYLLQRTLSFSNGKIINAGLPALHKARWGKPPKLVAV
jgi:hypothetical protein